MIRARRALVIAVAAAAAAPLLAGCEKPAPGVSVWSGTTSINREALCWTADAAAASATSCAEDVVQKALSGDRVPTLNAVAGSTLGISVDTVVASTGWYPTINGQRLTQDALHDTYYRLTFPQAAQRQNYTLAVIAGQGSTTRGLWAFKLDVSAG
ncbi:MAG: hypothetical protein EPO13_02845 [Actinomycetota bacterium]|nr:MAG: hypothetical protein EPO13_02845 [Actinomycetota bacterium]